jgi:hypothetical protein
MGVATTTLERTQPPGSAANAHLTRHRAKGPFPDPRVDIAKSATFALVVLREVPLNDRLPLERRRPRTVMSRTVDPNPAAISNSPHLLTTDRA